MACNYRIGFRKKPGTLSESTILLLKVVRQNTNNMNYPDSVLCSVHLLKEMGVLAQKIGQSRLRTGQPDWAIMGTSGSADRPPRLSLLL